MPGKAKVGKEQKKAIRLAGKKREKDRAPAVARISEDTVFDLSSVGAWFLGPKGENHDVFVEGITRALNSHTAYRKLFYPQDPEYVTDAMKELDGYKVAVKKMDDVLDEVILNLRKSVGLFTQRSMGHMTWDTLIAANVGYFAGMLFNQNNVAAEASPYTTELEQGVAYDLCEMFQYNVNRSQSEEKVDGTVWGNGHLVSGGSSANIEAMWAARELKCSLLAYRQYLETPDAKPSLKEIQVKVASMNNGEGGTSTLLDLEIWDLLNIATEDVLDYQDTFNTHVDASAEIADAVTSFSLQAKGLPFYAQKYSQNFECKSFGSWMMHYSLPKASWVLGFGTETLKKIEVDEHARMRVDVLSDELQKCLDEKIPVLTVTCIMGTTLESAVDPLKAVLALRDEFNKKGLNFTVHGDAAWGGYMMAMVNNAGIPPPPPDGSDVVPGLHFGEFATEQFLSLKDADSITVDPHKAGFTPYPAGAICFKDQRLMAQTNFSNPYIQRAGEANVGVYGLQGSKPGAAAVSVHMAHRCVSLDTQGYGLILAQMSFATKLYYCLWQTMCDDDDPFIVITGLKLPEEGTDGYEAKKQWIRDEIVDIEEDYSTLQGNEEVMSYLRKIGPDTCINTFAVNFKLPDGSLNKDMKKMLDLNDYLFKAFSKTSPEEADQPEIIFTSTQVEILPENEVFFTSFIDRLGLTKDPSQKLYYLVNTLMCPWSTSEDWVLTIEILFRQTVLQGIEDLGLIDTTNAGQYQHCWP